MNMWGRTALIVGLAVRALQAGSALSPGDSNVCCPPRDVRLSAQEMKARLRHTVRVLPLLGKDVRVKGIVVFVVGFDARGDVVCIRFISGHPLLVAPAIESVKQWEFQAGSEPSCGKLVLALSTLKPDMGLQVLEKEPPSR